MTECVWLSLTARERGVLRRALAAYAGAQVAGVSGVESLMTKLQREEQYPAITIGVHGGLVQWVMGNPGTSACSTRAPRRPRLET